MIPALETAGDRSGNEIFSSIAYMPKGTKICCVACFGLRRETGVSTWYVSIMMVRSLLRIDIRLDCTR